MKATKPLFLAFATSLVLATVVSCTKGEEGFFRATIKGYDGAKEYVDGHTVYWVDGDAVRINNGVYHVSVVLGSASIQASDVTSYGGNFYATFPASISSVGADGTVTFNLPRAMNYTLHDGNQVLDNIMVAKADGNDLDFENLCSLLHFRLRADGGGSGARLLAIEVSSDKPLCGTMTAHWSGSAWEVSTPVGGSDTARVLTFPSPVALTSTTSHFYILVPPVDGIGKFRVRYMLEDADGTVRVFEQRNSGGATKTLRSGWAYNFESYSYDGSSLTCPDAGSLSPLAMDGTADHPMLVASQASWNSMLSNNVFSSAGQHVRLLADVTVGRNCGVLKATLDGNGNTVTMTNPDTALFTQIVGGTVRNLTLRATRQAQAVLYNGGGTRYYGSLACWAESATISGCQSYIDVETDGGDFAFVFGGLIGKAQACSVEACANYGNVNCVGTKVGGVIGDVSGSSTLVGCANYGTITFNRPTEYSQSRELFIGGVVGYYDATAGLHDCYNYGNINVSGVWNTADISIGGLVGMTGCDISNSGCKADISSSIQTATTKVVRIGGLVGKDKAYIAGRTETAIMNCYYEGSISSPTTITNVSIGGIMGRDIYSSVKNCYVYGDISGCYLSGIVGDGSQLHANENISNCYYYGTMTGTTTLALAPKSKDNSAHFAVDHFYFKDAVYTYRIGGFSVDAGGNDTISATDPFSLVNSSSLSGMLNANLPLGGRLWRNGTDHVVFE